MNERDKHAHVRTHTVKSTVEEISEPEYFHLMCYKKREVENRPELLIKNGQKCWFFPPADRNQHASYPRLERLYNDNDKLVYVYVYTGWVCKEFGEVTWPLRKVHWTPPPPQGQLDFPWSSNVSTTVFPWDIYKPSFLFTSEMQSWQGTSGNTTSSHSATLVLCPCSCCLNTCVLVNPATCLTLLLWTLLLHRKYTAASDFTPGFPYRVILSDLPFHTPYQRHHQVMQHSSNPVLKLFNLCSYNYWTPLGRAPALDPLAANDCSYQNQYGGTTVDDFSSAFEQVCSGYSCSS